MSFERDLDDEMKFHLEMEADDIAKSGISKTEAERRARVAFGSVDRFKDETREQRPSKIARDVWSDLLFGVRWLRAAPGFTIAAVLTLGIGVGASAAILGAAHHIMIQPLPYKDADRVVTLREHDPATPQKLSGASIANFLQWQTRSRSFTKLGIGEPYGFDLNERGRTESLSAMMVSEGFVDALGAKPELGRMFNAEDYKPGAPTVVMISHDIWQRKFGGRRSIVNDVIRLDDADARVVGVLAAGVPFPEKRDLWAPRRSRDGDAEDNGRYMVAVGRLAAGVSVERAQRELASVNRTSSVKVVAVSDHIFGPVRTAVLVLSAAVALLLMIACANIANLLLARGLQRKRELAVRTALGANTGRLMRQLFTETSLLVFIGGLLGLLIAYVSVRGIRAFAPVDLPRVETLRMNAPLVLIAFVITLICGTLVGVAPARFSIGAAKKSLRVRHALVSVEIAFAIILLVAAGLLTRSFLKLTASDLGFEAANRVEWQTFLWDHSHTPEARMERVRAIERELSNTRGVRKVAATSALPFHPHRITQQVDITVPGAAQSVVDLHAIKNVITPGYFDVMNTKLERGRDFSESDNATGRAVAILNKAGAKSFFNGADPLGKSITLSDDGQSRTFEIVGVSANMRPTSFEREAEPEVFVPHAQDGTGSMTFVAYTDNGERRLSDGASAIWRVDPGQTIYHSATLESLVSSTLTERRFHMVLISAFSLIGLLLSAIGVYGLLSFSVRARSKEIGIRMAVGASPRVVVAMILREATAMAVPGLIAGMLAALVLTRGMAGMLYGVKPIDLPTLLGISVTMLVTAYIAAVLPAFKAARTQPINVLRAD